MHDIFYDVTRGEARQALDFLAPGIGHDKNQNFKTIKVHFFANLTSNLNSATPKTPRTRKFLKNIHI